MQTKPPVPTHRSEFEAHQPAVEKFVATSSGKYRGVILTLKGSRENGCIDASGEQYDFVSRYFAPWAGIKEDPVTGEVPLLVGAAAKGQ